MKYALTILITFLFLSHSATNAQWEQTNGPFGADVTSVLIHKSYKFAGTRNGLYRSVLESNVWQSDNETLKGDRVEALTADTKNIYAGTNHGLYKTSDEGISWSSAGLPDRIITALAIKDSLLFAGTVNGIFVSPDKGLTWKEVDSGLISTNVVTFAMHSEMILVSTLYDGLYSSSDNGVTWKKINFEENEIFAVCFLGDLLLVSSWDNVVYRSTDLGTSWKSSDIGINGDEVTNFALLGDKVFAATNYGLFQSLDSGKTWQPSSLSRIYIHELVICNNYLVAGTFEGVYISTDLGLSWTENNEGLLSGDVTSLVSSGSKIYAGTYGFGVFQSTDNGATWSKFSNGLSNVFINGLGIYKDYLLAGTNGGTFRTGIPFDSWTKVSSVTGSRSFVSINNKIIAGSDYGVLFSTDTGQTWKIIDSTSYQIWNVLAFDSTIIAGCNNRGIRISTNNGLNWDFSKGLQATVNALAFAGNNVLVGTSGVGVFLSSDSGKTWSPTKLDSMQIQTFQVFGKFVFAGTFNGIFRSSDEGITWNKINGGLDGYFIYDLTIAGDYIYAGVNDGAVWRRPLSEITSVSENNKSSLPDDFALFQNFPNPFNPSTNITYSLPKNAHVILKIYDVLGREITTLVNEEKSAGYYSMRFDGSKLSSGVYFYRIQAGNFVSTKKFVLMK